jgi:hypothetical protein
MSIIGKLTRNPMEPLVAKLGAFQKADMIPKMEIEKVLEEMERVNVGFGAASHDPRIRQGQRDKLKAGYNQFNHTIAGVRADLNNPALYRLVDGNYIKVLSGSP